MTRRAYQGVRGLVALLLEVQIVADGMISLGSPVLALQRAPQDHVELAPSLLFEFEWRT
jgi:hypothetical protein